MNREYKEGQLVRRFAPVPSYDISGMENWLADLAEEGLLLTSDGFFADIAKFEVKAPCKAKYRLEAIQHNGDVVPDSEQVELGEKYSWEYICKRGDFFIFRSFDPSARELNTDPGVQALALNVVKKKQRESFSCALFFVFIYPILLTRGCLLLSTIVLGIPWMVAALILSVCAVIEHAKAYFHLKQVQKSLSENGYYESETNWRKNIVAYQIKRNVSLLSTIILLIAFIMLWLNITAPKNISIKDYNKPLPFATISDFAGENGHDYKLTMEGFLEGQIDVISEHHDWIAPQVIEYNEHAQITKSDGNTIDGGLYVDYIQLRKSWMAKVIVKELYRMDKFRYFKGTERIDPLDLNVDSIICYKNIMHAPTIVIQKGCIVLRAYFYQTSPNYQIPFSEWAEILSDSIQ